MNFLAFQSIHSPVFGLRLTLTKQNTTRKVWKSLLKLWRLIARGSFMDFLPYFGIHFTSGHKNPHSESTFSDDYALDLRLLLTSTKHNTRKETDAHMKIDLSWLIRRFFALFLNKFHFWRQKSTQKIDFFVWKLPFSFAITVLESSAKTSGAKTSQLSQTFHRQLKKRFCSRSTY